MAVAPEDLPAHGGDLAAAEARWARPINGWLDLSTGCNPWPYPLPPIPADSWTRLPDAADDAALRRTAAAWFGAPGPDWVLPAPGSGALIRLLPRLRPPGPVAVVGPTYGEHAAAWAAAGHAVRQVATIDDIGDAPVAVVVTPNNPDGRTVAPLRLAELAAELAGRGGLLVADEAFADAVPGSSAIPGLAPGMVVLRSLGKFHGLPGLRLGFAVARPEALAALEAGLGPWAVSGPALVVGRAALADRRWAEATLVHLARAAARLDRVLLDAGLGIVGGTPLFRLAETRDAPALWDRLGRAGILTRAFAGRPVWLRLGLPPDEPALRRLARALGAHAVTAD